MKSLDEIIDKLLSQQKAAREMKKAICKEKIAHLLNVLEYQEFVELLDEVFSEQFAKGEMASHRTEQYQNAMGLQNEAISDF